MSTPVTLTAISGGINRLRTKGGADKNSLFDLLNGYVTQAGTVKVREGTYRNANITPYSGAGKTKGLMAYQSQLHVFSDAVTSVPPGYALHVINHPAGQQSPGSSTVAKNLTLTVSFNSSGGLGNEGVDGGFTTAPPCTTGGIGSLTGGALPDGSLVVALYSHDVGAVKTPVLAVSGTHPQSYFATLQFTDANTHLAVNLATSAATTFDTTTYPGFTVWRWLGGGQLGTGTVSLLSVTAPATTLISIPLKEINFSAPYLGGIYVSATFNVTDPAVLAQWGDTFHFWIQSSTGSDTSNTWVKDTDYQIGDVVIPSVVNGLTYVASRRYPANPVWAANTTEALNNVVEPTVANGFQYTATAVLGAKPTTGLTEPTWPTSDGATVNENSSIASDQTVTRVTAAKNSPTPPVPARYSGNIAGNFTAG